jgi:hypothetical protein
MAQQAKGKIEGAWARQKRRPIKLLKTQRYISMPTQNSAQRILWRILGATKANNIS